MDKLKRLDVAKGYVDLLREVERLRYRQSPEQSRATLTNTSAEIRSNLQNSPDRSLMPYVSLRNIAIVLKQAQPAAEDAAPHLIDHVEKTALSMRRQIKDIFAAGLDNSLAKIKWPTKDARLMGTTEQEWVAGVERLLRLQEPYAAALQTTARPTN